MGTVWVGCAFALIPVALIVWNLSLLRPPGRAAGRTGAGRSYTARSDAGRTTGCISVLIPARDEARNIAGAVDSVLANRDVSFELIVLERSFARRDGPHRRRSARAAIRESGSSRARRFPRAGKASRSPVRSSPPRLAASDSCSWTPTFGLRPMRWHGSSRGSTTSGAAMLSGIPRQIVRDLGRTAHRAAHAFHHVRRICRCALMRARGDPSLGAACGQLLVVDRGPMPRPAVMPRSRLGSTTRSRLRGASATPAS